MVHREQVYQKHSGAYPIEQAPERGGGSVVSETTVLSLVAPSVGVGRVKINESHRGHGGGAGGDQSSCEEERLEHVSSPWWWPVDLSFVRLANSVRTSDR